METLHYVKKVWIDADAVQAITIDGIQASYALKDWPRLANATPEDLNNFWLSYGGIHWTKLDEDLSFDGMFHQPGLKPLLSTEDRVCYDNEVCQSIPSCVADESTLDWKTNK